MKTITEAVEPGCWTVEMTPAYGSKDQDKLFIVAEPFLDPIEHARDDLLQVEGKARSLADQRIAEHLEELTPIKPKVAVMQGVHIQNQQPTMENGKEMNAQSQAQDPPQGPQQQSC